MGITNLLLVVVEVGGYSDHGVLNRRAQIRLGRLFQLTQHKRTNLRWRICLVRDLHPGVAILYMVTSAPPTPAEQQHVHSNEQCSVGICQLSEADPARLHQRRPTHTEITNTRRTFPYLVLDDLKRNILLLRLRLLVLKTTTDQALGRI